MPDKKNDGASRGDICHCVFECLGRPDRIKHYRKIVKSKDPYVIPSIKRLIEKKAIGHCISDKDNISQIKDMIVAGLEHDFFGKDLHNPTEAYSEYEFDLHINENGKDYRIKGFIDKLFLYKKKNIILIRDFKTSKKVFEGDEKDKNLQDYIYSLAVKYLFPEYGKRKSEFVFLKFPLTGNDPKGLLKMEEISDDKLESFELEMTKAQSYLENFNSNTAKSNYAADKRSKGGFEGPIVCGFASYPGEPKKNGDPKWYCTYKFPFDFYALYDDNDAIVKTAFMEDYYELVKLKKSGYKIVREKYQGCPRWNRTDY